MKLEFSRHIFEKSSNTNFRQKPCMDAELFHADGRTDEHDEANSRFSYFRERP
jgi:hypothetical protein